MTITGFQQKPLPIWLRIPSTLLGSTGIYAPKLTPERLMRVASRRAGLPAQFSSKVKEGLEVLCKSLEEEADLQWLGRMNYWNLLTTGLTEYLLLNHRFEQQPELANQKLNQPIFVTGMPRSGTTFLHRLLSASDDTVSMPFYQLLYPSEEKTKRALRKATNLFNPFRWASKTYEMDAIHFVRPKLADECNFGMRLGLQSMIYWSMAPTHSYLKWLLQEDAEESYQIYRKALQLQQARHPNKRLVLKCPHHLAFLPGLARVFPEAIVVESHRSLYKTIASECKLMLSLHALGTKKLNWKEVVDSNCLKAQYFAQSSVDFAKTKPSIPYIHVNYKALVQDPVNLALEIYQRVAIPVNEQQRSTLEVFFDNNRQNKHGKNSYSMEQFGLTKEFIDEKFTDYQDYYAEYLK